VYKYADVVVKTFGLAGSTVTLFLLEKFGFLPMSSSSTPALVVLGGAVVVFYAAYLYIAPPLAKDPDAMKMSLVEEGQGDGPGSTNDTSTRVLTGHHFAAYVPRDSRITLLAVVALASVMFAFFGQSCDLQR
jgi:hypothetical protein